MKRFGITALTLTATIALLGGLSTGALAANRLRTASLRPPSTQLLPSFVSSRHLLIYSFTHLLRTASLRAPSTQLLPSFVASPHLLIYSFTPLLPPDEASIHAIVPPEKGFYAKELDFE